MDLGLTWQDINDCIISAYGSQSIKESSFAQDLLDRLLFCLHMLIPSVKIFSGEQKVILRFFLCSVGPSITTPVCI